MAHGALTLVPSWLLMLHTMNGVGKRKQVWQARMIFVTGFALRCVQFGFKLSQASLADDRRGNPGTPVFYASVVRVPDDVWREKDGFMFLGR